MSDIRYCVTAFIDLLGFASHLEIGADLRTNIGQQAIQRLDILKNAIRFVNEEKQTCPEHYPEDFNIERINDALVITLDLPEILKPEVGQSSKNSLSEEHLSQILSQTELNGNDTDDKLPALQERYFDSIRSSTHDLFAFCGLVSRIFNYIKKQEGQLFFPGPKGVVSTGYRKTYQDLDGNEDYLSANFAFSNAYIAESKIKNGGSALYFDNNILQLLSIDSYSKNLVRQSLFVSTDPLFDPATDYDDPLYIPTGRELKKEIELELFRKKYVFREVNSRIMSFFQIINYLSSYIKGEVPTNSLKLFQKILTSLNELKSFDHIKKNPISTFNLLYTDIGEDVRIVRDLLVNKDSPFMQQNRGSELVRKFVTGTSTVE